MGVYRAGDVIRRNRQALHMTQEELCEGICNAQTLSRIENGKQNPGKEVYKRLMERMGKEKNRAFAMVSGDDVRVLEYAREYENALHKFEYEKADEVLQLLEGMVDDSPISRQYLLRGRAVIDWNLKRITPGEGRKKLKEALAITVENAEEQNFSTYPLMENEIAILYNIANTYCWEGKIEEAILLLETVYSGISSAYRIPEKGKLTEILILTNLSNMYGELGKYKKAIELAEQGIVICKEEKVSSALPQLLAEKEWNMEQQLDKEENVTFTKSDCERILRQACYLASALDQKHNLELIRRHYKEYFGRIL